MSGRFSQSIDTALPSLNVTPFKLDAMSLNDLLTIRNEITSDSGIWIERSSKCWSSDDTLSAECALQEREISYSFSPNGVWCNRYWQLSLELKSVYSDQTSFTDRFIIDDLLVVCPPNYIGATVPVLLDTPIKFIPGHQAFISLETTVIESLKEETVEKESFKLATSYFDCSRPISNLGTEFVPAQCQNTLSGKYLRFSVGFYV